MNNKLKIFAAIALPLFLVIFLLYKKTPPKTPAPSGLSSVAQTTLTISPSPLIYSYANTHADIVMDTGENEVKFVQLKLIYNPKDLFDISFTKGTFLKDAQILQTYVDKEKGSATYILSIPVKEKGVKGKGVIATISFKPFLRNNDYTYLKFSPETLVTDATHPSTVLKNAKGTQIMRKDKE